MQTTKSAFKPVENLVNYHFYVGYDEVIRNSPRISSEDKSEKVPVSPFGQESKESHKRKWTMEQKVLAVKTSRKMGVSRAISYLGETQPTEFYGLSTSTLQYWVRQSQGRKKRYYE